MKNTAKIAALKYATYFLLLFFFYVLQTTPGLFVIAGVKPVLVIPAAIAVAMHEGEFVGGVYGAVAGIFCDVSSGSLIAYSGIATSVFCVATGLLVIYLFRCNLAGCLLFAGATLAAETSIQFLFEYGMWGHESVWKLYVFHSLPVVAYSLAAAVPIFWIIRALHRRFEMALGS